jgi:hypothetical protein
LGVAVRGRVSFGTSIPVPAERLIDATAVGGGGGGLGSFGSPLQAAAKRSESKTRALNWRDIGASI